MWRSFWRMASMFLLGGIVGTAFGVAVGFVAFPYVFPPPPAMDTLSEADRQTLVGIGPSVLALMVPCCKRVRNQERRHTGRFDFSQTDRTGPSDREIGRSVNHRHVRLKSESGVALTFRTNFRYDIFIVQLAGLPQKLVAVREGIVLE